jgi:trimethylamine:corrinoid methyltransferase-like protein
MPINIFTQNPLKIFSDESVKRIHQCVLDVLANIGVRVDDDEAISYLADYGVKCDRNSRLVFPDSSAVEKALKTVGRGYTLYRRTPGNLTPIEISSSTTHALSGAAAIKVHHAGKFREATQRDLHQLTCLHEKLDNIHLMINVVEPGEMRSEHLYAQIAGDLFTFTSKPLLLQANG